MRLMRRFDRSLSARLLTLSVSFIMLLTLSAVSLVFSMQKAVGITDDGVSVVKTVTYKSTVGGLLKQRGIVLNTGDKMNVAVTDAVTDNMNIEIYRAIPITVLAQGETKEFYTIKRYPVDILNDVGYHANENDIITPDINEIVAPNAQITLIKTAEEVIREQFEIPYESKKKDNNLVDKGIVKLVQEGKNGLKEIEYKIQYHDGVEYSREVVSEMVLAKSVPEIKEVGTKGIVPAYEVAARGIIQTSRSGELRYSKVLNVTATAYDLSYASTGKRPGDKGYGVTATGMRAQRGVIAVDPRVIPYYSKLYIEAPDGSWVYGTAVAGDTGGAIKGNKIDLFFDTADEVRRFGRKQAKVYVLE